MRKIQLLPWELPREETGAAMLGGSPSYMERSGAAAPAD